MTEHKDNPETKEKIMDAAANVFARLGFQKARVDDIAKEAGVSKGGIYWHFKSKDEIILQIVDKFLNMDMKRLINKMEEDLPVEQILIEMVEITHEDLIKMKFLMPLVFEFLAKANRDPMIHALAKRYYDYGRKIFAEFFQKKIDNGELKDLDAQKTAHVLVGIYEGLILVSIIDNDLDHWREYALHAMEVFIHGLKN